MTEVAGFDTIKGLAGLPPSKIKIPYNLMHSEELLRQQWNECFIAILPCCFSCHEPLVWHTPPEDEVLFHCPKCKRTWVKAEDWRKHDKTKKDTKTTG